MARKDLVRTTASVTFKGVLTYLGEFRSFTGGAADSADIKNAQAAGQGQRARGGRGHFDNIVIAREDDGTLDLVWLATLRGKADMTIKRQPLDDDGNPKGKGQTYTGKLKRVKPGDGDANSDTDLDEFELEQSTDGMS